MKLKGVTMSCALWQIGGHLQFQHCCAHLFNSEYGRKEGDVYAKEQVWYYYCNLKNSNDEMPKLRQKQDIVYSIETYQKKT